MSWYRLSFTIPNSDLDANLSAYRDKIQGGLGKLAGRDAAARVYSRRGGESSEIFIEMTGREPPSFFMRLMLCEPCAVPPTESVLQLLGELRDGELRHAGPGASGPAPSAPDSLEPA